MVLKTWKHYFWMNKVWLLLKKSLNLFLLNCWLYYWKKLGGFLFHFKEWLRQFTHLSISWVYFRLFCVVYLQYWNNFIEQTIIKASWVIVHNQMPYCTKKQCCVISYMSIIIIFLKFPCFTGNFRADITHNLSPYDEHRIINFYLLVSVTFLL